MNTTTGNEMTTINQEVIKEFDALRDCGVNVSNKAYKAAKGDLSDYDNMKISELADLLIMLNQ